MQITYYLQLIQTHFLQKNITSLLNNLNENSTQIVKNTTDVLYIYVP
jgi:hypothetical protein